MSDNLKLSIRSVLDRLEREETKLLSWGVVDGGFSLDEVEDHARDRVRLATEAHLDHIVVAMAVRIRRSAEEAAVFLLRELRIPADVRRRKLDFPGDEHF